MYFLSLAIIAFIKKLEQLRIKQDCWKASAAGKQRFGFPRH